MPFIFCSDGHPGTTHVSITLPRPSRRSAQGNALRFESFGLGAAYGWLWKVLSGQLFDLLIDRRQEDAEAKLLHAARRVFGDMLELE